MWPARARGPTLEMFVEGFAFSLTTNRRATAQSDGFSWKFSYPHSKSLALLRRRVRRTRPYYTWNWASRRHEPSTNVSTDPAQALTLA